MTIKKETQELFYKRFNLNVKQLIEQGKMYLARDASGRPLPLEEWKERDHDGDMFKDLS